MGNKMGWKMLSVLLIFVIFFIQAALSCSSICLCDDNKVYCAGRRMSSIPRDLPPKIKYLDFTNNRLPIITIAMMRKFNNIRGLLIRNNGLVYVQSRSLRKLKRMKHLDLRENNLKRVSPETFATMTNIRKIFLSDNKLKYVDTMFFHNPRLQTLALKNNLITRISDKTFMNNPKLKFLDLSLNQITFIHKKAFAKMTGLRYLFLGHNQLRSVDTLIIPSRGMVMADFTNCSLTAMISGLPRSVRDLRYEMNFLTNVSHKDLKSLVKLGFLTLSWNNISQVDDMILGKLKFIYNLYLDNNELSNIPRRLPPNMRTLFLQNNNISGLPGHLFKRLKNLETINLQNNRITNIHGAAFKGLSTLRNLKLCDNNLQWLKKNVFKDLGRLDALDISRNPILRIDGHALRGLKNVMILQMSQIPYLNSIGNHVFADTKNLRFLDVNSSPKIGQSVVSKEMRQGYLHKVEDLNLMNNDLHKLHRDFPYHLPSLQMIKLIHNPWICSRQLRWMHHWLKNRTVEFYNIHDIRCAGPEQLKRRPVQDVRTWEFKSDTKLNKPPIKDDRENSVIPMEVDIDLENMFKITMEGETFQTLPTNEELKLTENSGNGEG